MHDLIDRVLQEIRAIRADLNISKKLDMVLAELAAIRREQGSAAELAKLAQRVEGITSTVEAGTESLSAAVEANKPE